MATEMKVVVEGATQTRRLLGQFAPDVRKALDKANRELVKPLISAAKSNAVETPLSNWAKPNGWRSGNRDLSYNAANVRRGIKVKQGGRSRRSPWSALMQLRNETPAGNIMETAGRKTQNSFSDGLDRWWRVVPNGLTRVIWKAAFQDVGLKKIQDKILDNYKEAERELQRRMDNV